jgi:hypothetical protein
VFLAVLIDHFCTVILELKKAWRHLSAPGFLVIGFSLLRAIDRGEWRGATKKVAQETVKGAALGVATAGSGCRWRSPCRARAEIGSARCRQLSGHSQEENRYD